MQTKVYKPKVDRTFWWISVPTLLLLLCGTVLACFEPVALFIMLPVDALSIYFVVAPLLGYVELREHSVFIKYGPFLKREIPYVKIRAVVSDRKFYSESMLSLKCAMEHVNIKYNSFDVTSVSVDDNDGLIAELERRRGRPSAQSRENRVPYAPPTKER